MNASISLILLQLKMFSIKHSLWNALLKQTKYPKKTQDNLLLKIVSQNKNTVFGKQHDFAQINSVTAFKQRVPVQNYEDLRSYIENQEKEKKPYLNVTQPVMYAQTSGTTGKPKYIPILKKSIAQYKDSQHLVAYAQYKDIPGVYSGSVLAIVSPAEEGRLETGTPYGSMSGLIYESMPKRVLESYVVPPAVFSIADYELKYYLITLFALADSKITLIATANPSTILKVETVTRQCWDQLLNDIRHGNEYGLAPNAKRADQLAKLTLTKEKPLFSDFWPALRCVTTWMGGNCATLIPKVQALLESSTKIVEMGYLSSEFRGSIPIDVLNHKSIPTIHENYFEFIACEDWDNNLENYLSVDELQAGIKYYVIVTTQFGLYRYFINDIIEIDGMFNNTPTIRFSQKGKGVTNLTGEKLYEAQVIAAMQALQKKRGIEFEFFLLLAYPESLKYVLYLEAPRFEEASRQVEECLSEQNIEFNVKRASDRIKPIEVKFLEPGTAEQYKIFCIENGQREGQFKVTVLQYAKDCLFKFNQYLRD